MTFEHPFIGPRSIEGKRLRALAAVVLNAAVWFRTAERLADGTGLYVAAAAVAVLGGLFFVRLRRPVRR